MIFQGLSGFPITPIKNGAANIEVLYQIREHIDHAGLDSIGVLGSTGSFAYLNEFERERVMACWSQATTPWIAGVSATTTLAAVRQCNHAKKHGAQGVIANAFAYVPLSEKELKTYFLTIADNSPLPVCVYDNPVTTGQTLSDNLLIELAAHANIHAIKVFAQDDNKTQHNKLKTLDWHPGYAVDALCCEAMIEATNNHDVNNEVAKNHQGDASHNTPITTDKPSAWYSTLAGTVPELLVPIMDAIKAKDVIQARALNQRIAPVFQAMKEHSGYRVVHALANQRGWTCDLPSPLNMPELENLKQYLPPT